MKVKITSVFFLLITSIVFAQETIPQKKELLGKWVIKKDTYNKFKTYLVNSKIEESNEPEGINIFIDTYTGTMKIEYVRPPGITNQPPRPRCATGPRSVKNFYRDYDKYTVCAYDPKNGKLKVSDPSFLRGKLFHVKKVNFREIQLIKIK
ncbi:hypothetical protein [uncultured Aquimarina sp.]|uniref:hypothetical protein n=1 Tax=uncultured Aquimarina sp. TaxID=575652 RepID=UPI002604962E|nr:hypothetical protein [uncultured Aquimarina sp.]